MSPEENEVGDRIGQALKGSGLRFADAAREIGVSERAVTEWVAGRSVPRGVHLAKLALLTGRSANWILEGDNPVNLLIQDIQTQLLDIQKRLEKLENA